MSGELFPAILSKKDVGDWLFPSSNNEGIPNLLPSLQPRGLETPINRWGAKARKVRVEGQTIHFYTDDYRFNALWKDPSPIINCGCRAMAEPNFSTNGEMPLVVAKSYIYAKRWISRWAQSYGIEIWADLAVNNNLYDIALIGVPKGWRAYSTFIYTRGYSFKELEDQFAIACDHAGTDDILFWVYGGEHDTQAKCQARGWLWTPAHQQAYLRNIGGTKQRKPASMKRLEKHIKIEPLCTLEMFC